MQENHVDFIGTLVKQYKTLVRKKGARVADFMHEHGVDIVITGHAGEGGVEWLKVYGIDVKLVADSGYTVQDAIEASSLAPRDVGPVLVLFERENSRSINFLFLIGDEYLI